MTTDYVHVDVFSSLPYSGNSLAVSPDARGLTAMQMLRITQELRHFETVFCEPAPQSHTVRAWVFDLFSGDGEAPGVEMLEGANNAIDPLLPVANGSNLASYFLSSRLNTVTASRLKTRTQAPDITRDYHQRGASAYLHRPADSVSAIRLRDAEFLIA